VLPATLTATTQNKIAATSNHTKTSDPTSNTFQSYTAMLNSSLRTHSNEIHAIPAARHQQRNLWNRHVLSTLTLCISANTRRARLVGQRARTPGSPAMQEKPAGLDHHPAPSKACTWLKSLQSILGCSDHSFQFWCRSERNHCRLAPSAYRRFSHHSPLPGSPYGLAVSETAPLAPALVAHTVWPY